MTPAHALVTQACLGILLHLDENVSSDSLAKFPLAKYAAGHWFKHARFEGVSKRNNAVEGMKRLFDERKPHFAICSGYIRQGSRRGDTTQLESRCHPMELPYITRLFVTQSRL